MRLTEDGRPVLAQLRLETVGIDTKIPLLDGSWRRYVFLDNAASTPTFRRVLTCVQEFLPWYSGIKRGLGLKAMVATRAFEEAHAIVGDFVGADLSSNVVVFVGNTTEAVNKLANRFRIAPDDVVITTMMEHHSNDLPWRKRCRTIHVGICDDGSVDLAELKDALNANAGSVKLVAVSGASNVAGVCNPIYEIAGWAHAAGAKVFVDAAQLAPHRQISLLPDEDPRHIDFLAFSGHKIYAPFGTGVLVGPREFFEQDPPDLVGGGTVSYVGLDEVEWTNPPSKDEAGSPNVVGAVALAYSLSVLKNIGMNAIAEHERRLLAYATKRLKNIPGIRMYGPTVEGADKVGVVPFTVEGIDHALVATILSVEGGVGVRNGNFCAQIYMRKLLGVTPEEEKTKRAARCDNANLPGMVRASFGCYNNEEDVDIFVDMLERISRRQYRGKYQLDPLTGTYRAEGFDAQPSTFFRIAPQRGSGSTPEV